MTSDTELLKLAFEHNTAWSEYATLAVFVGLLGDIAVILFFDFFDKDTTWTQFILAGLASIVIAVGVYGEYRYGHRATAASRALQDVSDRRIAETNERATVAERDAAAARLETARIEKEYGPRKLLEPQLIELATKAAQFSGEQATFSFPAGDVESAMFANQLAETLDKGAKWKVGASPYASFGAPRMGLTIVSTQDQQSRDAAKVLADELTKDGIPVPEPLVEPDTKEFGHRVGIIFINVDGKPLPILPSLMRKH